MPWQKTSVTQTAGMVPVIQNHLVMGVDGVARYKDNTFPPPTDSSSMLSIRGLYSDWGSCPVEWGTSPPCRDDMAHSQCPKNSVCLRLHPSSPSGMAPYF